MSAFLHDTVFLLQRHIRATVRMPVWIIITLIQPVLWLTFFGQLFRRVVELPGFAASAYIDHLAPGIVVMTALFGAAWSGMGLIQDLDTGVLHRMLATQARRAALIVAPVLHAALTVVVQGAIVLVLALALGARVPGAAPGVLAALATAGLLGAGTAALSHGVALLARREEALVAVVNFFGLPLTFLSTAFMAPPLMPPWMRVAARWNPVDWAVRAARDAMAGEHWGAVLALAALLAAFLAAAVVFSLEAFRVYRRAG